MKFPTMVYRCPGPHTGHGCTYAFLGIADQSELNAALEDGWHKTLPEAMGQTSEQKELEQKDVAPTREELEQKAKELKIRFGKGTSDAELLELINDELGS